MQEAPEEATPSPAAATPSRASVVAAFAAVYTIWGSTYLAILFAIETIPPFLMAGVRFLIAGAVLYAWVRLRGAQRPPRQAWKHALVIGGLLLLGGNGAVVWAEQSVPSGVAALLVASVPFWMVLLDWLRPGGVRPTLGVLAGLLFGFGGIALLVGPGELGGGGVPPLGAAVLVVGSFAWSVGSIYSRGVPHPEPPLLGTAMEMLCGGALLVAFGLLTGEGARLALDAVTLRSLLALLYLIVFGSLIGYSAYVFLLKVSTPARVSTYAYVNPVVAVLLGWAFAGEPLTLRILTAPAVIVGPGAETTGAGQGRRRARRARSSAAQEQAA